MTVKLRKDKNDRYAIVLNSGPVIPPFLILTRAEMEQLAMLMKEEGF